MIAEGELELEMAQLRNTAVKFISRVIPDTGMAIRTRPLEALIIGAYVRGLSDRDIESLLEDAGLGKLSRSTASRICQEHALATSPSEPAAWPRSISWFCS